MNETIETLRHAPFNKIRMCVFPKHYLYNNNDPKYYAFGKRPDGSWDPDHPCFAFWDAFEKRLHQLFEIGIEVDLISVSSVRPLGICLDAAGRQPDVS
jgi:hypothetical protein